MRESKEQKQYLILILKYLLGAIIIAVISFYVGNLYQSKNTSINYVSQREMLALERDRISAYDIKDRQLFFGRPKEAIKYIEQMQKEKRSRSKAIILLTDGIIYGSNVHSISKEVHKQIIDRLSKEIVNE